MAVNDFGPSENTPPAPPPPPRKPAKPAKKKPRSPGRPKGKIVPNDRPVHAIAMVTLDQDAYLKSLGTRSEAITTLIETHRTVLESKLLKVEEPDSPKFLPPTGVTMTQLEDYWRYVKLGKFELACHMAELPVSLVRFWRGLGEEAHEDNWYRRFARRTNKELATPVVRLWGEKLKRGTRSEPAATSSQIEAALRELEPLTRTGSNDVSGVAKQDGVTVNVNQGVVVNNGSIPQEVIDACNRIPLTKTSQILEALRARNALAAGPPSVVAPGEEVIDG